MSKENLGQNNCSVCLEPQQMLYNMSNCNHYFCKNCCISYIKAKTNNFSQSKCLQERCNKPLDLNKQIYQMLSQETKQKISKFHKFNFLQTNPDVKECKVIGCEGRMNIKDKIVKCSICNKKHCRKCYQFWHKRQCKRIKEEQKMIKHKFRKCPKCSIWVQKTTGCSHITCKCGLTFCYKCGLEFDKDPCRNKPLAQKEMQIRKLMRKIYLKTPQSLLDYICIFPKIVLIIVILLPLLFFFSFVVTPCVLLSMSLLIVTCGPLALCIQKTQNLQTEAQKRIYCLLMVLLYPLWSIILFAMYYVLLVTYIFCRNQYRFISYDKIDGYLSKLMVYYLSIFVILLHL